MNKDKPQRYKKSLYGIGINDAPYPVQLYEEVDGKIKQVFMCPYYQKWKSMFSRCYSIKYQERCPSYIGCAVAEEWHYFMTFRKWMVEQDWEGKHLDKDLLNKGNKIYSPDTCIFIDAKVNLFINDKLSSDRELPVGVVFQTQIKRYQAKCNDVFGKNRHLGCFGNPEEASIAYQQFKYEQAILLASMQTDPRVAQALLDRYKI